MLSACVSYATNAHSPPLLRHAWLGSTFTIDLVLHVFPPAFAVLCSCPRAAIQVPLRLRTHVQLLPMPFYGGRRTVRHANPSTFVLLAYSEYVSLFQYIS